MKRLLSIWLRNWPIQRLQSEWHRGDAPDPLPNAASNDQSTAPVILWKNDPRRGRLVVGCCAAAQARGARPGIALAQAAELVGVSHASTASPIAIEHDPIADSIALERLAEILQNRISPLVAVESLGKRPWSGQVMLEPETLFCDLSGVTHLFDDEAGILNATHRCLSEFGVVGKLAIADNSAAAWAHSHYNAKRDFISTHLVDDLHDLSVNCLRIESEIKYTLDRLGIETVDALLRLPRGGLARRLGDGIVKRIAEVSGEMEVPLEMHHAQRRHQNAHELEYATDDLAIIVDRVGGLIEKIVASLAANQCGALRMTCRLDLVGDLHLRTVVGLFAPTIDQKHLNCLISSSLESLKLPSPVEKITLAVVQSGPLRTQQNSLFADDAFAMENDSVSDQSLARLVDALSGRLGRDAVLGVRLSNNPLPEKAYRTYSLTDHRTRKALRRLPSKSRASRKPVSDNLNDHRRSFREATFHAPGRHDARRRPMKLLRQPVRMPAIAPTDTPPHPSTTLPAFQFDGRIHRVLFFWGPERIETGWWEGPTIRRDYYRAETDSGNLWWIFRDLKTGEWFLHGRFS